MKSIYFFFFYNTQYIFPSCCNKRQNFSTMIKIYSPTINTLEISNSNASKQARRCAFKQSLFQSLLVSPGKPHLYQNRTRELSPVATPQLLLSIPTPPPPGSILSNKESQQSVSHSGRKKPRTRGKKNPRSLEHRIYPGHQQVQPSRLYVRVSLQLPCVISA